MIEPERLEPEPPKKRKRGRPRKKPQPREYEIIASIAPPCPKCKCTDTEKLERSPNVKEYGRTYIHPQSGQPYTRRVIRNVQCANCGQWRRQITYENPAK